MAFDGNLFQTVDDAYGDTHRDPALRSPAAQAYLETHNNLYSGDVDVIASELDESLQLQEQELRHRDPALLEQLRAHLAITDARRQDFNQEEVA